MATSALPSGGLIDPTKHAEYPIVLGDRLAAKNDASPSRMYSIQYNYKSKSATANQRSLITKSSKSPDQLELTITDKAPNAEQNTLTYSYYGSVDPDQALPEAEEHNLVLVFDSTRKVFVLEPVATQYNFNLRAAPAKTRKQVLEQYTQLKTLHQDEEDRGSSGNDDGPADESNPYDFRHFLPKDVGEDEKSGSDAAATPDPYSGASKANTPLLASTARPAPSPKPRPKKKPQPQPNPLRMPNANQPAKQTKPPAAKKKDTQPPPRAEHEKEHNEKKKGEEENAPETSRTSPSDTGAGAVESHKPAASPGSKIIVDGDLIIDMGSPPPSRPAFKVNPAHFSSNNTPANGVEEEEHEEIEEFRLPSPAGHGGHSAPSQGQDTASAGPADAEDVEDDDALAAEMEAAFEESAREEEQGQQGAPSYRYHVPSDDESEVSEEE